MDIALIWVIAGLLLILTELLATSVIAVFFGIAAIIVGLLMWAGIIDSPTMQFFTFATLSLVLLFATRARLHRYLVGDVADHNDSHRTFRENLGQRASAIGDFSRGQGRVRLNGVAWQAQSSRPDDEIIDGDTVWIVANDGIKLIVSKSQPINHQA